MTTKHTPGPWEADDYHVRQKSTGTRMIADVCYTGPHHTPPDEYPKSCRLVDEANARLIAAAPELLEMLERFIDETGENDKTIDLLIDARFVVAKAKGETP